MPDEGATTTATTTEATTTETQTAAEVDWKAEAERIKAESRKWEERAKTNSSAAKDLEKLRTESMSEQEKAVAAARDEGLTEGRKLGATRLVDAEVKVAAVGRPIADVDALIQGLDRTRFMTEEGEPDTKAIVKWLDQVAPKGDGNGGGHPDLSQGHQGNQAKSATDQVNAWIRGGH
jgi:alanyl-tRNA synthetase